LVFIIAKVSVDIFSQLVIHFLSFENLASLLSAFSLPTSTLMFILDFAFVSYFKELTMTGYTSNVFLFYFDWWCNSCQNKVQL